MMFKEGTAKMSPEEKYKRKVILECEALNFYITGVARGYENPALAIKAADEAIRVLKDLKQSLIYFRNAGSDRDLGVAQMPLPSSNL